MSDHPETPQPGPSGASLTARGLRGAWRLFRLDRGGVEEFRDESDVALWHSFNAYFFIIPAGLILSLLMGDKGLEQVGLPLFILQDAVRTVLTVAASLLAACRLAQAFGYGNRIGRFVMASNWSGVISAIFYGTALLLARALGAEGEAMPPAAGLLLFCAMIWTVFYGWFVVRQALACGGLLASAMVLLDLTISLAVFSMSKTLADLAGG